MLLNTLHYTEKPPTTQNYPAANVDSAEVGKPLSVVFILPSCG